MDTVLKLLDCQKLVCTNVQLPVSVEMVDDILAFLGEINVKRFAGAVVTDNPNPQPLAANPMLIKPTTPAPTVVLNRSVEFEALHSRMADVCFALIQHRHFFIVDRVPQFVAILRDLLQSVAWFKSGRRKEKAALDSGEVTMLADLAHRIEK